jgi:hypothetical protein
LRRQHDVAILAALALLNTDQHPAAVDGSCCHTNDLADTQAGAIGSGQGDPVAQAGNSFEEPYDLVAAEYHRQSLRFARRDDLLVGIAATQGDAVEEAQRADHLVDVRPRPLLCDEIQLVGTHILQPQPVR